MQGVNLSDDELWCGIAENTNAMSALVHQLELGGAVGAINDHQRVIEKLQREYRDYTAELRRRFPATG